MILENCYECLKPVEDDEWVTNWGSCHACFNKHLEKYPITPVDTEGTYGSH